MEENKKTKNPIQRSLLSILSVETVLWMGFGLFTFLVQKNFPDEFYFRYPKALWINILIAPLYILLFQRRHALHKLVSKIPQRLLHGFLSFESDILFWRKWIFVRVALFFLVLALAQPLFGTKKGVSLEKNSEVVIALDVSNSMNTLDVDPRISRLEIAKRAAIELINGLQGEKLGVLIFAGNAFVQLPITKDYNTAKLFIGEIETKMLSNQGTNFAIALEKAKEMFSDGTGGRCILMITDGENHEKIPSKSLKELPSENIFLAVVGLGTANGGLVLRDPQQPFLGYVTDEKGRPVLSKVGKKMVTEMAKKANGIAMITDDPFPNLSNLLTEINQLNKGELRNLELDIKEAQYHFPLLFGIVFWLLSQVSDFRTFFRRISITRND